ncbi:helix-turn-helix domain-containing protein [Streptomyces sp. AK08-02]|uniref:helix-turn-helix domain-containing protein n=1 Tax=Streptomyces sp. AK08-02 TaxID=3028654 RepID=UPI0029A4F31D|nr:helix-turn-helix domain-containing protein [Streptomyces sp. AK08-02]MDX3753628.1 helix-turn-helix domain containing protein [Streptomyces sp. AK08-02]
MSNETQRPMGVATAPTGSSLVIQQQEPTATTSNQLSDLTEAAGSLRYQAKFVSEDTAEVHMEFLFRDWRKGAVERGKQSPTVLLEELSDLGFSWRHIARMLGVSVPAVQKWRRSGGVSGDNRMQLASLLALCDMVQQPVIHDVASWFEMPLTPGIPVTPIDLFTERRPDLVLEHALGPNDVEEILTAYAPNWRERYQSDFEVYRDMDGAMSIRQKEA